MEKSRDFPISINGNPTRENKVLVNIEGLDLNVNYFPDKESGIRGFSILPEMNFKVQRNDKYQKVNVKKEGKFSAPNQSKPYRGKKKKADNNNSYTQPNLGSKSKRPKSSQRRAKKK